MEDTGFGNPNSGRDPNAGREFGPGEARQEQGNNKQGAVAAASDMAQAAASSLGAGAQDIARRAREQASVVYEQGGRAGEYLTRNVNEYPATALLVAGMIGYGIAYLVHGGSFASDPNSENAHGKQTRQRSRRHTGD